MHLDTESDAWQARSSLVVTDTSGADIAMPEDVRVYLVSGVQHAAPRPMARQVTQLPGNLLGYGAFMRVVADCIGRVGGAWRSTAGQPLPLARCRNDGAAG